MRPREPVQRRELMKRNPQRQARRAERQRRQIQQQVTQPGGV